MGISSAKVVVREERVRRMTSKKRKIENVKTRKRENEIVLTFTFSRPDSRDGFAHFLVFSFSFFTLRPKEF
jgi:hypothetical protein